MHSEKDVTVKNSELTNAFQLNNIRREVEFYGTFLPDEMLNNSPNDFEEVRSVKGVLMQIDLETINSFTDSFYKTNKGSVSNLARLLNSYFGALMEVVSVFCGDLLKLSETTILIIWPDENASEEVVKCALLIRDYFGRLEEFKMNFSLKIAVAQGNNLLAFVGDDFGKSLIVFGPIYETSKMISSCNFGDVCLSYEVFDYVSQSNYDFDDDGFCVKILSGLQEEFYENTSSGRTEKARYVSELFWRNLKKMFEASKDDEEVVEEQIEDSIRRASIKKALQNWTTSELRPFIFKSIIDLMEMNQSMDLASEMCAITICCVEFKFSMDCESDLVVFLNGIYQDINQLVLEYSGSIYNFLTAEKTARFFVVFGVQGSKSDSDAYSAFSVAFQIRSKYSRFEDVECVSMGIAHDFVFCGVVGRAVRREYLLFGGCVLKSRKLVEIFPGKIMCDFAAYKNSKMPSKYFKTAVFEDDQYIFECSSDFGGFSPETLPLIGKESEAGFVRDVISNSESLHGYLGICFHGGDGLGKTKFIRSSMLHAQENGYSVASASLSPSSKRPYFCVSVLYKQLYDAQADIETGDLYNIKDIHGDVWNLNEILQDDFQNREYFLYKKIRILNVFSEICKKGFNGVSAIFVDNVQYIDEESLEILETILQDKRVRFICMASFQEENWHVKFKLSLSKHMKCLEWKRLQEEDVVVLSCQLLSVRGIGRQASKRISAISRGKSGRLQKILLKLINNGHLVLTVVNKNDDFYTFPQTKYLHIKYQAGNHPDLLSHLLPVAKILNESVFDEENFVDSYYKSLFDSFTPLQKEMAQIAAVLGASFTRNSLQSFFTDHQENDFDQAIKIFFQEDLFCCGSMSVSCQALTVKKLVCLCAIAEEIDEKYVYCKYLRFKNEKLKTLAYASLSERERNKTHSAAILSLQKSNNNCATCLKENFGPVLNMREFKESACSCAGDFSENSLLEKPTYRSRTVWDLKTCHCLEILLGIYNDLIFHSEIVESVERKAFFLTELSYVYMIVSEFDDALDSLNAARDLCVSGSNCDLQGEASFWRMLKFRINLLAAECNVKIDCYDDAREDLMCCLKLFAVKVSSSYAKLSRIFIKNSRSRNTQSGYYRCPFLRTDLSRCMYLASVVLGFEKQRELATFLALKSVTYLQNSSYETSHICEVFANLIRLYTGNGRGKIARTLEKILFRILSNSFGRSTVDRVAFCKVLFEIFQTRVMLNRLTSAIDLGFQLLEFGKSIRAHYITVQTVSILASSLLCFKKIHDAVNVAKRLHHLGKLPYDLATLAYYAFCLELKVETSFMLEQPEKCLLFAERYFAVNSNKFHFNHIENKILILLLNYYLRKNCWIEGNKWKRLLIIHSSEIECFLSACNWFKYTESLIIALVRNREGNKSFRKTDKDEVKRYLIECQLAAEKWPIFLPRFLHFSAYYNQIKRHEKKVKAFLKVASSTASLHGNRLEECWIIQSKNSWNGGFSFGNELNDIDWKMAKSYNSIQWSQIMYALPCNQ